MLRLSLLFVTSDNASQEKGKDNKKPSKGNQTAINPLLFPHTINISCGAIKLYSSQMFAIMTAPTIAFFSLRCFGMAHTPTPPHQGLGEWKKTQVTGMPGIPSRRQLPALARKGASARFIIMCFFLPTHHPLTPCESLIVKMQENLSEAETKNGSLEPGTIWKKHKFSLCLGAA